jgi:hypothetical protein
MVHSVGIRRSGYIGGHRDWELGLMLEGVALRDCKQMRRLSKQVLVPPPEE